MRHDVLLITAAAEEPISLEQARDWLREDDNGQDAIIQELIRAARQEVEGRTGRSSAAATYRDALDDFPGRCGPAAFSYSWQQRPQTHQQSIALMRSPLIAVSSIQYYDCAGALATIDAEAYSVDTALEPGRIIPALGYCWPDTQDRPGAVRITYTAGYSSASLIPGPMLQAMRMLIAHWYQNREAVVTGTISTEVDLGVNRLLSGLSVGWEW